MARGWHYTNLPLSSALLLSFSGMCFALLFLPFCRFCFVFSMLLLELCRCSSDIFMSSRPRIELATTCSTVLVLRIDTINTAVQRCARKSTEFASRWKIVGDNQGEMGKPLVTQDAAQKEFC